MGRTIGVSELINKIHKRLGLAGELLEALGNVTDPFTWLIFGHPKNGKTTFVLKVCRVFCEMGLKVYYNSIEEGESGTFQEAFANAGFNESHKGKFMFGDRDTLPEMIEKLQKNKAKIVVIDSRDYMRLTTEQWKKLTRMFPKKCFVLICWEQAGKPKGVFAKDIEFMVSMVTRVSQWVATTNGRFGSDLKFVVWPEKVGKLKQQSPNLFNNGN